VIRLYDGPAPGSDDWDYEEIEYMNPENAPPLFVLAAADDRKRTSLKTIRQKTSLGDVSSLLVTGFIEQERRGIPANFYRMSVGIEDPEDIIADLKQALES